MDSTADTGTRIEISKKEFDLDGVHGGLGGLHTQKDACMGCSSEFTIRLVVLRDGSIGSFAHGDTFGPNLGSFRGREA